MGNYINCVFRREEDAHSAIRAAEAGYNEDIKTVLRLAMATEIREKLEKDLLAFVRQEHPEVGPKDIAEAIEDLFPGCL